MVIGFDPVIAGATVQAGMIVSAETVVTIAAIERGIVVGAELVVAVALACESNCGVGVENVVLGTPVKDFESP